ncbi:MAG: hypothetical protein P8Y71_30330, partial [Pseudolabrys sp.]
SAFGPATIGRRSTPPYAFSGPGIVEIRVTGTGRVSGAEWIEGHAVQPLKFSPWAIMNLPHPGGRRYLSLTNYMKYVELRIAAQSPKRLPLQETLNAPSPRAAPLSNPALERARIESLARHLTGALDKLISATEPPLEQIISEPVTNEHGDALASASGEQSVAEMALIERIHQLQFDPGTASLIGYKILDDTWKEVEDRIIYYRIIGFFRDFPPVSGARRSAIEELFDRAVTAIPLAERSLDKREVLQRFTALAAGIPGAKPKRTQHLEDQNDYVMLETLAVADRQAPLDQVERPTITSATHKGWLPAVPPAAIREVETKLAGVRVSGLLAAGRRQPASGPGRYRPINRKNEDGFFLPLLLGLHSEDGIDAPPSAPGVGFIADRTIAPDDLRVFIAQEDRFGRWSEWASTAAAAGPRPRPPRPHLQGYYQQPAIADAATHGGTITVHVAVPDNETLAPGSLPLDRVRVIAQVAAQDGESVGPVRVFEAAAASKITFDADSVPTSDRRYVLVLTFDGPVLSPTILTAHWIDTHGRSSVVSEAHRLRMTDPRAPVQVPVPDVLLYSARPDVTGLAWVEHRWTSQPGQSRYGVYYTDENRLVSHLEQIGATSLLDALAATSDRAVRAGIFRDNHARFPDALYERLRDVNVRFNSGEVGFRHALSGSSRILNAYKIAAEAESGARPSLTDLELILYGVPNSDPPQRPTITVNEVAPGAGENARVVRIDISLLAGTTIGHTWRLRRTRADSAEPRKVPIVATGALSPPDAASGIQTAFYRDGGPVVIASTATLAPWVRYTWVAEVQGAPESGSTVPGRWSRPSDPVSLVLVPEDPPTPLEFVAYTGTAVADGRADLGIELTHPETLAGGALGYFVVRLARRLPNAELAILSETNITAPMPLTLPATVAATEIVPFGTEFVVTLIDPTGRSSAPANLPPV